MKMSYLSDNKINSCSGCGLCSYKCPRKAISMNEKDGFLYPSINLDLCNDCGLCKKICPFDEGYVEHLGNNTQIAYAYKNKDAIRTKSASGGFFTFISDYVLSQNGIVYGAVYEDDWFVVHARADSYEKRDLMRGSKYMQSSICEILDEIKTDVEKNKKVLFTGTPCQCGAILGLFNNKKPENLLLMEVICHGVLPRSFLRDYAHYLQEKNGAKVININLRDKKYGWQTCSVQFENGIEKANRGEYFYQIYGMNSIQRESCFNCKFATNKRISDFSVGDFWGMENYYPELKDNLGVSIVLANSNTALRILDSNNQFFLKISKESYFDRQPNLSHPTTRGSKADKFKLYYYNKGLKKTIQRYFEPSLRKKINIITYKMLHKLHLR